MNKKIEVIKEVRFAIVMYGGVSLAIYINGVAQELLRMVRATALDFKDKTQFRYPDESDELDEVEKAYRDLSYLLADEKILETVLSREDNEDWRDVLHEEIKKRETVKVVRFVVDILSGSSAGGINGVYMAKALVGGQSLRQLERLWELEGDFAKLLCDRQSVFDGKDFLGLTEPVDAPSLLNSQRMYLKLLTAFDRMDDRENLPPRANDAAFVDEVDLFVTMTDFWGIPVPVRLFDQLIYERRHRQNVRFRFRKDEELNELGEKNYPFLAYSARCTSSFPLAFDPMQGAGANSVINEVNRAIAENRVTADFRENFPHQPISQKTWKTAFSPTTVRDSVGSQIEIDWEKRVFVDGGYLDNKPFGYAIEALAQKQSDVLIERKLIYVEPEPDLDDSIERGGRTVVPLALENIKAALTDMPRYETIREDLEQVLQRNRLIARVNGLVSNARLDELSSLELSLNRIGKIVEQQRDLLADLPATLIENGKPKWHELTLGELAQQKNQGAYSYYRLRVAALSDDLAKMVTRRAGFDEHSDYFLGVRDLVYYWRMKNFNRGEENVSGATVNSGGSPLKFLDDYDYNYRLRRLRFVLHQADRLLRFDKDLTNELKLTIELTKEFRKSQNNLDAADAEMLQYKFMFVQPEVFLPPPAPLQQTPSEIILDERENNKEEFEHAVREFKKAINAVLQKLKKRLWEINPDAVVEQTPSNRLRFDLEEAVENVKENLLAKNDNGVNGLEMLLGIKLQGVHGNRLETDYDVETRYKRAEKVINDYGVGADLDKIGELVCKIYNNPRERETTGIPESLFAVARAEARTVLDSAQGNELERAIRTYLRHFYDNFDAYDQILFPITYETPIGEAAAVDVARISPLDALSLVEGETLAEKQANARKKVAGGAFSAFGAFFSENWRKNDILWGRLDAIERLLSIVLNNNTVSPEARQKIRLQRELDDLRAVVRAEMHDAILRKSFVETEYQKYVAKNSGATRADYMRASHQINRDLPTQAVYGTTSRSLKILSKVINKDEKAFGTLRFIAPLALATLRSFVVVSLVSVGVFTVFLGTLLIGGWQVYLAGGRSENVWLSIGWIILMILAAALFLVWLVSMLMVRQMLLRNVTGK